MIATITPPPELWNPTSIEGHVVGMTFMRTVERQLVHRDALAEVFVTDLRELSPTAFVAAAQLPRSHAHYGDHLLLPACYDPVLLLEAARQASLAAAHAQFAIPEDHKFILTHVEIDVEQGGQFCIRGRPCELFLLATTSNHQIKDQRITGLDYEYALMIDGAAVGRAAIGLRFKSPSAYAKLRVRQRNGVAPLRSDARLGKQGGLPVQPNLVGRRDADNVVLLDAQPGEEGVRALLRLPGDHPSLFDHPQDHLPGMLLSEAARQITAYALAEDLGMALGKTQILSLHAEFLRFGELEPPTELSAQLGAHVPEAAGRSNRISVQVTTSQQGTPICKVEIAAASTCIWRDSSEHQP